VHVVLNRPAVDEQAAGDGEASREGEVRRKSDLGAMLLIFIEIALNQPVGKCTENDNAQHHANAGGEEDEAALALTESVVLREHDAEGGKEKVQDAVCYLVSSNIRQDRPSKLTSDGNIESH
jgi:hypothetical protein